MSAISRQLLGKIVDEVFDGAIEDASVVEEIYAVIKRHERPPEFENWAKQITTEISDAIGLGSEMFVRHGDIYRIDPTFVAQYIRERRKDHHDAMHRNVSRIRQLEAKLAALSPPHPHSSNS